jgi:purine nucleosidase
MPRKIILDCDPGHDDALAILLAEGSSEIELVGITTVAGNQTLEKTTLNARRVCTVAGMSEVPIAAGCAGPMLRQLVTAGHIHGETGLDGPEWPEPTVGVSDEHAVEFIVRTLMDSDGDVSIVATGPLTNVAMAVRREPRIVAKVAEVTLMGGAFTRGNVTPAAEFNIYVDPEAASIVFTQPWERTMVGLDLTHQALATPSVVERIASLDTALSRVVVTLLEFYRQSYAASSGLADPPVHDPCAVAALAFPDVVEVELAQVAVETGSDLTRGMTVTDFGGRPDHALTTRVAVRLDAPAFWDRMIAALARLGEPGP